MCITLQTTYSWDRIVADLVYESERSSSSFDFLLEFVRLGTVTSMTFIGRSSGRPSDFAAGTLGRACIEAASGRQLLYSSPRHWNSLLGLGRICTSWYRIKVIKSNTIWIKTWNNIITVIIVIIYDRPSRTLQRILYCTRKSV